MQQESYLVVHDGAFHKNFTDGCPIRKVVIGRDPALGLALGGAADEPTHHVKLAPVYLRWIRGAEILVAFMRSYEVRDMYLASEI